MSAMPPWRWVTPCPPPLSIAWRMAPGEAFLEAWLEAMGTLDDAGLAAYLDAEQAPAAWASWVRGIPRGR